MVGSPVQVIFAHLDKQIALGGDTYISFFIYFLDYDR